MLVALQVIVTYVIECIYSTSRLSEEISTSASSEIENEELSFVKTLLVNIITITRRFMTPIQFASLFVSVGRQLEPHQFNLLFPLPSVSSLGECRPTYHSHDEVNNANRISTIEDLYYTSVTAGSVPIAASILPLLTKTKVAHAQCVQLLHHCITVLFDTYCSGDVGNLTLLWEAYPFLQQLYRYGTKLEASFRLGASKDDESRCKNDNDENNTTSLDVANLPQVLPYESRHLHDENEVGIESRPGQNLYRRISTQSSISAVTDIVERNSGENSSVYRKDGDGSVNVGKNAPQSTGHVPLLPTRPSLFSVLFTPHYFSRQSINDGPNETAISEAASDFILSGYFDVPVIVDDSTSDSTETYHDVDEELCHISEERSLQSAFEDKIAEESIRRTTNFSSASALILGSFPPTTSARAICIYSVADIVGRAIISEIFTLSFLENEADCQRLKLNKIAALSQILLCDDRAHNSLPSVTKAREFIFGITSFALENVWNRIADDGSVEVKPIGAHQIAEKWTWRIIFLFSQHLDLQASAEVYELILSILAESNQVLSDLDVLPFLAILAVASSHACKRTLDLLGNDAKGCTLGRIYTAFVDSTTAQMESEEGLNGDPT